MDPITVVVVVVGLVMLAVVLTRMQRPGSRLAIRSRLLGLELEAERDAAPPSGRRPRRRSA